MTLIYSLFISVFLLAVIPAQSSQNLDSLYSVWEDESQPDSTRIMAFGRYINLGFQYSNPDSAIVLIEQMLEFSEESNFDLGKSSALNLMGNIYLDKNLYAKSLEYFEKIISLRKDNATNKELSSIYNNMGSVYSATGDNDKAIEHYKKSLAIFRKMNNKKGVAGLLNNIGSIYKNESRDEEAKDYYDESLKISKELKDFKMTEIMSVVAKNVQWFEDNAPLMPEHKKKNVKGVSYKVVDVAGEAGDASPSTPIGVNLPNANWIRAKHGSKSVSLGNIVMAYSKAGGSKMLEEFTYSEEEYKRAKEHGTLASKLHTALHEVVGHASGQLNEGVGTPKETLKNYASTLEEGRADLVALYYLMDSHMVELGLMSSLEVGMAEYDSYIRNGMMAQLRRLEPGADIEEAHMRNRQLVASWAY